jgi:hypothetical protein
MELDRSEQGVMHTDLNGLHNKRLAEGKPTETVDELMEDCIAPRLKRLGFAVAKRDNPMQTLIFAAFGLISVIRLGLLIAPAVAGGIPEILKNLSTASY